MRNIKDKILSETLALGAIKETQDIKILICYIFSAIGEITKSDLIEAFQEGGFANYFQVSEAFSDLLARKNIKLKSEKGEIYALTETGHLISSQLHDTIPLGIRQKALKIIELIAQKKKSEKENAVKIVTTEFGYNVELSISGGSFSLLNMQIYAPDIAEAEKIKTNFRKDPTEFYKAVLFFLTKER